MLYTIKVFISFYAIARMILYFYAIARIFKLTKANARAAVVAPSALKIDHPKLFKYSMGENILMYLQDHQVGYMHLQPKPMSASMHRRPSMSRQKTYPLLLLLL